MYTGEPRLSCGRVPAQMWSSPGADVFESRRRCGRVPAQMWDKAAPFSRISACRSVSCRGVARRAVACQAARGGSERGPDCPGCFASLWCPVPTGGGGGLAPVVVRGAATAGAAGGRKGGRIGRTGLPGFADGVAGGGWPTIGDVRRLRDPSGFEFSVASTCTRTTAPAVNGQRALLRCLRRDRSV
jgi:hypothetical protein